MIGNISKSKGFKGDVGPIGPQGPPGEQGTKGDKGDTPSIVLRYDEETGKLYYNSDGILVDKEYVESQNLATKEYVDKAVANVGGSTNPDEVIEIIEAEHIKHRTHYAEDILKCDYTINIDTSDLDVDVSLEEQLYVHFSEPINLNKMKAYINGKRVVVEFYEGSNAGVFYVTLKDAETSNELVWFTYKNKDYNTGKPRIYFQPFSEKGTRVELYEENIVTLDEKYLPKSVPTMVNYDDVLLCEYTYNSADFVNDTCPTVAVRRIPNKDKIKFYVNGEQVDMLIQDGGDGDFYGCIYIDGTRFRYFKYWAESGSFVFYNKFGYEDGTVVQILEDGISALKDEDIPESIARVQDVSNTLSELQKIVDILYAKSLVKTVTINLLASNWVSGSDNQHSQIITIADTTPYSKIDLQPTAEQLTVFHEKDIAFVAENDEGVVTVYCIGQKPANDYTIQATITEVEIDG